MQAGRRYTLGQLIRWGSRFIFAFLLYDSIPVVIYYFFDIPWLSLPWQPISLIGIAVAFYLGFKNNSSYERLWEARKIWGGIVNTSRTFTVTVRDYINNEGTDQQLSEGELQNIRRRVVHRHVAWLHALSLQLRQPKAWEHHTDTDLGYRQILGTNYDEKKFEKLREYLSTEDYGYVMTKGNKASHLLSMQSRDLMDLRVSGPLEHFRHLEIQGIIKDLYDHQGKSERIKNFPFPRQYATVNYFFTLLFVALLPFGMLNVFVGQQPEWLVWLSIPFSTVGSWVFWTMEMIGDYSENPFEGLYNDVPISAMATDIERDIRQMLDESDLPEPLTPQGDLKILV